MTPSARLPSPSDDDRGQTLQDYVVGVSVFLIVVFVAMGFFPNLIDTFQTGSLGDHDAQADRIGRQIVTNHSVPGSVNELDAADLHDSVLDRTETELRNHYGLNETANINVTVESLNGTSYVRLPSGTPLRGQPGYFGDPAGTTARIVTLTGVDGNQCSPACRLVVRVW